MVQLSSTNDVIIVGAGVAGSALANTLGKDGRNVLLIEKNLEEPNVISGEVLQPSGYLKLMELGLDDCLGQIGAQKILGYAMHKDHKCTRLDYPLENYDDDVSGRSFHHGRFVQKLREKAASISTVKVEEGTAKSLIQVNGHVKGVQYTTVSGHEKVAYASLTILCDGRFSSFSHFLGKPEISLSLFAGLILESLPTKHPNFAHIVLANPSFLLFYPISDTEMRCLIDFRGTKLPFSSKEQMAHYMKFVLAPQVPCELREAFLSSIERGINNVKTMPVSCMPANPFIVPGAILVGDALNRRHAMTGGGMTVALQDVALLGHLLRPFLDFHDTIETIKVTSDFYRFRKPGAFAINLLADALYKVVYGSQEDVRDQVLRANFDYLSLDFDFTRTMVGLISGLNCNPWNVVLHFFALAIYITCMLAKPLPSPARVYRAARFLSGAIAVALPLIWKEGMRCMLRG